MPAVLEAGMLRDLMLQQDFRSLGWSRNILPALHLPPTRLKPHGAKTRHRIAKDKSSTRSSALPCGFSMEKGHSRGLKGQHSAGNGFAYRQIRCAAASASPGS